MSKQLTNKNVLLLAVGRIALVTDVVTTDNAIMLNPKASVIDYNEFGNGQAGNAKSIVNEDHVTVDFSVDVVARTGGARGMVPAIGALLKCCGLKEVVTAGIDVVYTPALIETSANAAVYLDGQKRDVTGIAGDFSISGKVGEVAKFNFSLKGFTDLEETAGANPVTSLDNNTKLIIKSAVAVTVGGNAITLSSFGFDLGNDVKEIYATSLKEYFIGDFKPTIKINAVKTKGNGSHWSELKSNSKKIIIVTLGTTAGNMIELRAPFCQPIDVSESDSDAKVVYDRTWLCQNSAGGDNFSLTFK